MAINDEKKRRKAQDAAAAKKHKVCRGAPPNAVAKTSKVSRKNRRSARIPARIPPRSNDLIKIDSDEESPSFIIESDSDQDQITQSPSFKGFSFYRDEQDAEAAGFLYRKIWVVDIPMLAEGQGLRMLKLLGLVEFARATVPSLDKRLCDEFILTCDARTGSGRVRGKEVFVDMHSVAQATGLPVGTEEVCPFSGKDPALKKLLKKQKKTHRGIHLEHLVYGEDTRSFQTIAGLMMVKLECKRDRFQYVSGDVLLAIDKSIRMEVKMNWAKHLAKLMIKAAAGLNKNVFSSSLAYQYGEWLTKIIANALDAEKRSTTRNLDPESLQRSRTDKTSTETTTTDAGVQVKKEAHEKATTDKEKLADKEVRTIDSECRQDVIDDLQRALQVSLMDLAAAKQATERLQKDLSKAENELLALKKSKAEDADIISSLSAAFARESKRASS